MKKQSYKILFLLLFGTLNLHALKADKIEGHNKTRFKVYAATYYKYYQKKTKNFKTTKTFKCKKTESIRTIAPRTKKSFNRPKLYLGRTRVMIFSLNKSDLKTWLTKSEYKSLCKIRIGAGRGDDFYVRRKTFRTQLFNSTLKANSKKTWKKKYDVHNDLSQLAAKSVLDSKGGSKFKLFNTNFLTGKGKAPILTKKVTLKRLELLSRWTPLRGHLRYDQACFFGIHNSFSYRSKFRGYPSQLLNMEEQLALGARLLMPDTYLYKGTIKMCHKGCKALGHPDIAFETCKNPLDLVEQGLFKPDSFSKMLRTVNDFLDENPKEIVTIAIENYAPPKELVEYIKNLDLGDGKTLEEKILTPTDWDPEKHNNQFPTIGWMRSNNKRLVFFLQANFSKPKHYKTTSSIFQRHLDFISRYFESNGSGAVTNLDVQSTDVSPLAILYPRFANTLTVHLDPNDPDDKFKEYGSGEDAISTASKIKSKRLFDLDLYSHPVVTYRKNRTFLSEQYVLDLLAIMIGRLKKIDRSVPIRLPNAIIVDKSATLAYFAKTQKRSVMDLINDINLRPNKVKNVIKSLIAKNKNNL